MAEEIFQPADIPPTIPLWTVEEVANYLRLKPETVRAMTRRGELPYIKLGRMLRFRKSSIDGWLQSVSAQLSNNAKSG